MSELWRPSLARVADANLTRFMRCVNARRGLQLRDYTGLYAWSLGAKEEFWTELAHFAGVRATWGAGPVIQNPTAMPGARFFPEAQLNFAENLLRYDDEQPALVFRNERGMRRSLSHRELRAEVARIAAGLRAAGVVAGDRIAGYLPNIPEAAIAMLAAASCGAIWSSCSPDFGVHGVLDRFGQISPRVLFTADGYYYAGKRLDSLQPMAEVLAKLDAVEHVVVIPYLEERPQLDRLGAAAETLTGATAAIASAEPPPRRSGARLVVPAGGNGDPTRRIHGDT